jgi:hypothetical protein
MRVVPVEVEVARAKEWRRLKKAELEMMVSGEHGVPMADDIEDIRREIRRMDDFIAEHSKDK